MTKYILLLQIIFSTICLNAHIVAFKVDKTKGVISGLKTQSVKSGDSTHKVTAFPSTNYKFTGWIGDYTGNENPLTIYNVDRNMTVYANFSGADVFIKYFTEGNGNLLGNTRQTVDYGNSSEPVTAVPESGYMFVKWVNADTNELISYSAKLTIIVKKPLNVKALFKPFNAHEVFFVGRPNGSINGIQNQFIKDTCNSESVTAIPDNGYIFSGWSGSDITIANPIVINNVARDMLLYANFVRDPSKVFANIEVSPPGSAVLSCGQGIICCNKGEIFSFNIYPTSNYSIEEIKAVPATDISVNELNVNIEMTTDMKLLVLLSRPEDTFSINKIKIKNACLNEDSIRIIAELNNFSPELNNLKLKIGDSETFFEKGNWNKKGHYGRDDDYSAVFKNNILNLRIRKTELGNISVVNGLPVHLFIDDEEFYSNVNVKFSNSYRLDESEDNNFIIDKFSMKTFSNGKYFINISGRNLPTDIKFLSFSIDSIQWELEALNESISTYKSSDSTVTAQLKTKPNGNFKLNIRSYNDKSGRGLLIPGKRDSSVSFKTKTGVIYYSKTKLNIRSIINN